MRRRDLIARVVGAATLGLVASFAQQPKAPTLPFKQAAELALRHHLPAVAPVSPSR